MQQGGIGYSAADGVATITMAGPSLTVTVKEELVAAIARCGSDPDVRCVVLTGSGRVFSAGQDLKEHHEALGRGPEAAFATISEHYNPVVTGLATMSKPVVAAINGTCAGAGLGFALACDVRVAAAGVRFTTAFTGIGLTADSGLSASLARAVGAARASELILLAEPFTAEQALAWGLVGRVVAAEEFPAEVEKLAARLAAGPTRAYAVAKRAIREAWTAPWESVLAAEERDQTELGGTTDHVDAVDAFLTKSRPI